MDKYEISLWEDFPDNTNRNDPSQGIPFLNERKICVIGSNTMTSAARALEPKLVSNVNGTHTFTFRVYYKYKDEVTGEENINPYLPYIINERKVKVLWKNIWYDLVIKRMEEDTQRRSVVCTCEDLFITELSKNGYELEFNSELQNNSGTAFELMTKVLDGSGWQPAQEQDRIIQYQEEPVYKVQIQNPFLAMRQSPFDDDIYPSWFNKQETEDEFCLLYQSCLDESCTNIQFLYSNEGYLTEPNDMLVLNGDCYIFTGKISYSGGRAVILDSNDVEIFNFDISDSYSSIYRAKRLVNSQVTVFDNLLERYVDVYTDGPNGEEVYGYETTEFSDPTLVVNLIANAKDFKDTKGWSGASNSDVGLTWQVYPPFTKDSQASTYGDDVEVKSYLKIPSKKTFKNSGLNSNKQYLTPNSADIKDGKLGGFQVGDKYIFRYKAVRTTNETIRHYDSISQEETITFKEVPDVGNYIDDPNTITFSIGASFNNSYFNSENIDVTIDNWVEFELTCETTCSANQIENIEIYIKNNGSESCWIEEVQFFKLSYGIPRYPTEEEPVIEEKRINPGEISLQSIANVVYRYYNPDHDGVEDPQDLEFLYQGKEKSPQYIPKYNNYEKITSIEESKSNRFNILQSIAEKFECWVRFIINHNQETGQILYDENGLPQKYVQLVEQIGHDTGISFEYGIDLKGIKRSVISNSIATKAIIIPNDNQFGKNGFCTIARSQLNYCRENFILNFDYYIQQGLLNQEALENDLYKVNGNNLGYYYYLNKYNRRYDALASEINYKQIELTKQEAEYEVQIGNLRAARQKKTSAESDLIRLANVDDMSEVEDYVTTHTNNRKVQSLMGTLGQVKETIRNLEASTRDLSSSIQTLKIHIESVNNEMGNIVVNTKLLHEQFFKKYSRFIQEGTWQDQNYIDDDKYFLDALEVAYRSSRPQIQYDISLLRLSGLEDFSSKTFDLGDICYVQDKEFFGYEDDGITPYKQRIIISQLTSYFDTPEKDVIKVQNYKTQFDDLFQRITTATQALQFSQGSFERAAGVVKPDKTLSFGLLQDTFDYNKDLVLNSANQQVTWDNTGITVTDETNSALKVRIMAGGIFASDDGGNTWKNALRGDGISTDLLTAGRINTSEIYMYDGNNPSFRWDSYGINAYTTNLIAQRDSNGNIRKINGEIQYDKYPFSKYVRFDQYGVYGYAGKEDFVPASEEEIWYRRISASEIEPNYDMRFGLTWKGFFLHGASGVSSLQIVSEQDANGDDQITFKMTSNTTTSGGTEASLEISTDKDIVLKTGDVNRIQIGRCIDKNGTLDYGIFVRDENGKNIFNVSADGTDSIGGWNLTIDSFYHTDGSNTLGLYSQGKKYTIQGITDKYYILAGDDFGVTIDGKVCAQAGKIGGWEINTDNLSAQGIIISSNGSISVGNGQPGEGGQLTSGWSIDSNGNATFHNIYADYGLIAGWHITQNSIYNNTTMINSSTLAMYGGKGYDISTGKIAAYGGNVGGWELSDSSLTGKNIALYPGSNGNGYIDIGGVTITGYAGGGISVSGPLYAFGKITTSEYLSTALGELWMGSGTTPNILYDADVVGLHSWIKSNSGHTAQYYTPTDVGL